MKLLSTAVDGGAALQDKIWVRTGDVLYESLSAVGEVETEQAKQNHGCSC